MATPASKPITKTAVKATADVDKTKIQKIINSSGVDISVCMPLTSAETEHGNAIISYNKDYVLLPAASGGNAIKAGGTDTITLDRTYVDSGTGKATYSQGYDLLVSSPAWLVPVANIGVVQDFNLDTEIGFFDDVTVPAASATAMQQTADFYQTIAAYPDSQLAKNYVAAMTALSDIHIDPSDQDTDDAAHKAQAAAQEGVADFFKGTKSYQQVTLATVVALEGYYTRLPFVWAQYTDKASYYLYSSDGSKTSFQGALSVNKSGSIDLTKANGGYTVSFAPAVNPSDTTSVSVNTANAKTLTYSDGLFVDDQNADLPTIALKGSFQLKRTFTKDPNDTKIMVVISGTVNGQVTVGFDQTQCTNKDDTTQDWLNSLFHPKNAAEIFNSVMQILGALMMLHFVVTTLWGVSKWIRQKVAAKEPVPEEDLQTEKARAQSEWKARQSENLKKVSADKEALSDSPENGLSKAADAKGTISDCVSAGQTESGLIKMKDNLKSLEEYVVEDYTGQMQTNINESATSIRESYTKINNSEIADLRAELAELRPQIQELSDKITKMNTDMENMVGQQQKAEMSENVKNMETVQEAVENESKTTEDEKSDATNDDPEADSIEIPDL